MKFVWMKPVLREQTCRVRLLRDNISFKFLSTNGHPIHNVEDLGDGYYRITSEQYEYSPELSLEENKND